MTKTFEVTGDLVFKTVPRWRHLGRRQIASNEQTLINLNRVTRCDSSSVALLLAWLRDARETGTVVHFAQLPQQLLDVAQVYGVLDIVSRAGLDVETLEG